jgi:hypothetical protein
MESFLEWVLATAGQRGQLKMPKWKLFSFPFLPRKNLKKNLVLRGAGRSLSLSLSRVSLPSPYAIF